MSTPRTLWMVYIVVILAAGLGRMIERILIDSGGFASRYGPAILTAIISIGIFGHAWQLRIGRWWWWVFVLILAFGAAAALLALELIILLGAGAPWSVHLMLVTGVVLLIPAQIALFHYACREPALWS